MYVGRTSEIANMTNFENFRQDLIDLVKKYERDIPLKVEEDIENNIIKISHNPNLRCSAIIHLLKITVIPDFLANSSESKS